MKEEKVAIDDLAAYRLERFLTEPLFEIIDDGKHYKIYLNGTVEGFSENCRVHNYAHTLRLYIQGNIDILRGHFIDSQNDSSPESNPMSGESRGFSQGTPA